MDKLSSMRFVSGDTDSDEPVTRPTAKNSSALAFLGIDMEEFAISEVTELLLHMTDLSCPSILTNRRLQLQTTFPSPLSTFGLRNTLYSSPITPRTRIE